MDYLLGFYSLQSLLEIKKNILKLLEWWFHRIALENHETEIGEVIVATEDEEILDDVKQNKGE